MLLSGCSNVNRISSFCPLDKNPYISAHIDPYISADGGQIRVQIVVETVLCAKGVEIKGEELIYSCTCSL